MVRGSKGSYGKRSSKKTRATAISKILWKCIQSKELTPEARKLIFNSPNAARVMIEAEPALRKQVVDYLGGLGHMMEAHARVNIDALIYLIERTDFVLGYDKRSTYQIELQPGLLDQTRFALEARGHVLEADGVQVVYPDDWPKDQSGEH